MATKTKQTKVTDLFAVPASFEAVAEANRKAGEDYLGLYERTVGQLVDLEVKAADAVQVPAVATILKTHADVTRKVAGTYVDSARELLKA